MRGRKTRGWRLSEKEGQGPEGHNGTERHFKQETCLLCEGPPEIRGWWRHERRISIPSEIKCYSVFLPKDVYRYTLATTCLLATYAFVDYYTHVHVSHTHVYIHPHSEVLPSTAGQHFPNLCNQNCGLEKRKSVSPSPTGVQ